MGTRAATLIVTNEGGDYDCQLRGTPDFRLVEAGVDLDLDIDSLELSYETNEPLYTNITLEPGQSAEAALFWRGEQRSYQDEAAQQAQVKLSDVWVDVDVDVTGLNGTDVSPFDLRQHSELEIGKWSPR